jgi:hypothetical protein
LCGIFCGKLFRPKVSLPAISTGEGLSRLDPFQSTIIHTTVAWEDFTGVFGGLVKMAASVDQKLRAQTKFPPEFNQKVDMQKVNVEVMKKYADLPPWSAYMLTED